MLTRLSYKVFVAALITALLHAGPAVAQYSSITDLGDVGGGASVATSINARGQIAGASLLNPTTERAFILSLIHI